MPEQRPLEADLLIRVTKKQVNGQTVLGYELTARDEALETFLDDFGSRELDREPEAWFRDFFQELENTATLSGLSGPGQSSGFERKGLTLFQLVFPKKLAEWLWRYRKRFESLMIHSEEPWIPWELCRLQGDEDGRRREGLFFCEAFDMTRWAPGSTPTRSLPLLNLAIATTAMPEAAGIAEQEKQMLLTLADKEHAVSLVQADKDPILQAMASGEYDGLHLACHACHDEKNPNLSYLVLDNNSLLTPESLTGSVCNLGLKRPLIFLNCCQSGRGGRALSGMGGWARAFLQAGAGAFIGTQWDVDAHDAFLFAQTFYRQFQEGKSIGQSVRLARKAIQSSGTGAWLAFTVFAHPLAMKKLDTRVPSLPGTTHFGHGDTGTPSGITDLIIPYGAYIAEWTRCFVGREFIFQAIEHFIQTRDSGYLVITGNPGIGKSSLLARLVQERNYMHHFNIKAGNIKDSSAFLRNICAQLIHRYRLDYRQLPPEATDDAGFFTRLLHQVSQKSDEPVLILVDALDEAEQPSDGSNVLCLPPTLPEGIYMVVTSRRGPLKLRIHCPHKPLLIEEKQVEHLDDIKRFIQDHLDRPGIQAYIEEQNLSSETFVSDMVAKSQGNFMYLRHVLPELEKTEGRYRDGPFEKLPEGLVNYYRDHWSKMCGASDFTNHKLPVIAALTLLKKPVSKDMISRLTGIKQMGIIGAVLREWEAFIYTEKVNTENGWQKRFRMYHDSFRRFLEELDEVADSKIDLKGISAQMGRTLYEMYLREKKGL